MKYELPLSEVLKTLNKTHKGKEIRVCDRCGVPMIWTFFFAYKERYCLNCGRAGGMMGTGDDVELTDALKYEYDVIRSVWKTLQKCLVPRSEYGKKGCKKCNGNYNHREHLTKAEIFRDETATKILNKLNENFTPIRKKDES